MASTISQQQQLSSTSGSKQALEQIKLEAAQELGIQIPADGYYGNFDS